jgi:ESCRT-I complex subunit TSG101
MMVVIRGTVPINYRGAVYNIPIAVYAPPTFPSAHPIPLVTPVAGMRVKDNHPHVALSGECYLPYLSRWASHSSLVGLVRSLQQIFAATPPVYAVAATTPPSAQPLPKRTASHHRPAPQPPAAHQPTNPATPMYPGYTAAGSRRLSTNSLRAIQKAPPPKPTVCTVCIVCV